MDGRVTPFSTQLHGAIGPISLGAGVALRTGDHLGPPPSLALASAFTFRIAPGYDHIFMPKGRHPTWRLGPPKP